MWYDIIWYNNFKMKFGLGIYFLEIDISKDILFKMICNVGSLGRFL